MRAANAERGEEHMACLSPPTPSPCYLVIALSHAFTFLNQSV